MKTFTNRSYWLALGLAVLTFACKEIKDPYLEQKEKDDKALSDYLESNNIDAEKSIDGYYFESIIANPDGEKVETGDIVEFYYTISTLEGEELESITEETDRPVTVKHINNSLSLLGLDFGLSKMSAGETFKFYIPSYLAYSAWSFEKIPANTNFIVEVKLLSTVNEEERKEVEKEMILANVQKFLTDNQLPQDTVRSTEDGLYYIVLNEGTGVTPQRGKHVDVNYIGTLLDGTKFDSSFDREQPLDAVVGGGLLIQGWEDVLLMMSEGAKFYVWIPSHLAYSGKYVNIPSYIGNVPKVPSYAPLKFYLEILE